MSRKPSGVPWRFLMAALAVTLAGWGCTKSDPTPPIISVYKPQTSQANVLNNLQVAYRQKNVEEYAKLLADDFQFYFDAGTRETKGLPEFWTRLQDSTATGALFAASEVTDIRISLTAQPPKPVNEVGKEAWTLVDVLDTFLEVDLSASSQRPEGVTFRVDGQLQKFYFRKGRTAADTDTSASPTAKLFYLVEWRDQGFGTGGKPSVPPKALPIP